jgi:hypothetical protein
MLSAKQKNSLIEAKSMTVCGKSAILQLPPIDALCAESMFNFTCFNVEDPDDPRVGLFNGELSVPGNLLRREVFDPVVNQVRYLFNLQTFSAAITSSSLAKCPGCTCTQALDLIEEQTKKVNHRIDALLLVGGFSGSGYLFKRVEVSDVDCLVH